MRILGTIVLGFLFLIAFGAFFLFQSVTGYPGDTEAVVSTLRAADVRTATLDTLEAQLTEKVRAEAEDPVFAEFALSQSRQVIDQVITDEWFYSTIGQAHRGLVDFLESGTDKVRIDLTETKDRLRRMLWEAGRHGVEVCDAVGGDRACYDSARDLQRTLEVYRRQVDATMAGVPDTVNLTWLLTRGGVEPGAVEGSSELAEAREGLQRLAMVRWAGLGALLLLLGLIVLVNMRSLPRMMVNAGIVLALASAVYLGAVSALSAWLGDAMEEKVAAERAEAASQGEPEFGHVAAGRVVTEVFSRMTGRATVPVSILLIGGLGLLGGGIALHIVRRRRKQPKVRTVPPPPPFAGPMPPGYYPPAAQ
ncbi:MAG: hypothetical protein HY907_18225 [Deltaproteobacteria bacterium]|nr:hypothetical protein [Deltaproteobacteria bacterium]